MVTVSRRYAWPFLALVLLVALGIGTFTASGPKVLTTQQRIDSIAAQIRCPTCQGLSVEQSQSPLAQSAKQEITAEVAANRTDSQIKAYFVSRYGVTALMSPSSGGVTDAAWAIPALVGVVLAVGVVLGVRKWAGGRNVATPTERDRQRVDLALGKFR